jgi:hypothetical protein
VDPTRLLYRFEADAVALVTASAAEAVTRIGVEAAAGIPFFRAWTDTSPVPYSVPLYEPATEHEHGLAAMLTKALELGRAVEVDYRDSVFFGQHRVPAGVRLA